MSTAMTGEPLSARTEELERLPMTSYQRTLFGVIASAWLVGPIDVALLTSCAAPSSSSSG
jgi:putative MFS transporter